MDKHQDLTKEELYECWVGDIKNALSKFRASSDYRGIKDKYIGFYEYHISELANLEKTINDKTYEACIKEKT